MRQLLVGYPHYTEDVIPGQGRAVKVVGHKILDDALRLELRRAERDTIYLHERPALWVRTGRDVEFAELALDGLPRYHEAVRDPSALAVASEDDRPPARELHLKAGTAGSLEVEVDGFLPFARLEDHWVPGGNVRRPLARVSIETPSRRMRATLLAGEPSRQTIDVGGRPLPIAFRWAATRQDLDQTLATSGAHLHVSIPSRGISEKIPLARARSEEIALEGTDYRLQVVQYHPRWTLASEEGVGALALVRVRHGSTTFTRAVIAPQSHLTRDMVGAEHGDVRFVDPDIEIALGGGGAPDAGLTIAGGPEGARVALVLPDGRTVTRDAAAGESVALGETGVKVTIEALAATSRREARPRLIPRAQRDARDGSRYALVHVVLRRGGENVGSGWVRYSEYPHPSRMGYFPALIPLEGGGVAQVVFSRQSYRLPVRLALDEFQLETYPGRDKERDYISLVRFRRGDEWSEPREVRSNQPTAESGWWFFQRTWDPPAPQFNHPGLTFSGIGVGNRHGVAAMLAGGIMTVLGTLWAFYVKPVLLRRRRERRSAAASPSEGGDAAGEQTDQPGESQAVPPAAAAVTLDDDAPAATGAEVRS